MLLCVSHSIRDHQIYIVTICHNRSSQRHVLIMQRETTTETMRSLSLLTQTDPLFHSQIILKVNSPQPDEVSIPHDVIV